VLSQNDPFDMLPNQYRHFPNKSKDVARIGGFGPIKRDRTPTA